MRVTLAVVTELMIEAFPQRTAGRVEHPHAPLAHDGRGIPGRFQDLRNRHRSGRER